MHASLRQKRRAVSGPVCATRASDGTALAKGAPADRERRSDHSLALALMTGVRCLPATRAWEAPVGTIRPRTAPRLSLIGCPRSWNPGHRHRGLCATGSKRWGTPCWRPSEAGLTLHEREREAILAANFLPYALTVMRGRRGCAQAKPASLAAGASVAQIQALCRWQTEDSLRVYARLNPGSYDKLLTRAASADVLSVSVASLPPLSSELAIRQLLGLSLVDALAASA